MSPKRLEVELTLRDTQRPELADDELNPTSGLGVRFNACDETYPSGPGEPVLLTPVM
jgi:hypothetical protein